MAFSDKDHLNALCALTLDPAHAAGAYRHVCELNDAGRSEFLSLADSNHVVLRALAPIEATAGAACSNDLREWAANAASAERERISNALKRLYNVCQELEKAGCETTVIKSLEHWPDLGSDLDLFTTAPEEKVLQVFSERLGARIEPRSWGDRLANKWNFALPELKESVEIHVQRLGQTGEHTWLAKRFVTRRVPRPLRGMTFFVPAPEERIIVATLQRMYRHFYFRVCDIVNSAALIESGELDYNELHRATEMAGIWPGVASYLAIVSDYVRRFRGTDLELPKEVRKAAVCGGCDVKPRARYLRVPMLPHAAMLYSMQVTKLAMNGDVPATFRLSLLPYLASAAAVAHRITGSDKGIW